MYYIILGYAGSGKDTLARAMSLYKNLDHVNATKLALHTFLYDYVRERTDIEFTDPIDMYTRRDLVRQLMYDGFNWYTQDDPTRMISTVYRVSNFYCGLRNVDHVIAARSLPQRPTVIWVDNSRIVTDESDSNFTVTPDLADHIVDNSGTLEQLIANIDLLTLS